MSIQKFYALVKSRISKDGDLPNFFTYYLTVKLGQESVTVSDIKKCYEDCDLHAPSWLASHFSIGLRSVPKRFIKKKRGYRLERGLRDKLSLHLDESIESDSIENLSNAELAGIEYMGIAGASADCADAVVALLQSGRALQEAKILTEDATHCLFLVDHIGDLIAIKSGFSSGYMGEGPREFSRVLQLLSSHGIEITEYEVSKAIIDRIDASGLTDEDVQALRRWKPVRPSRWRSYVDEVDVNRAKAGLLWSDFPLVVPFAIIDGRLLDLAISFWIDPDDRLLKAYRRLEDAVRERTGIDDHGSKLFSQAFVGVNARLGWGNIDEGERTGRGQLFTGVYMAYRNPRAHRELKTERAQQLTEFLILNHLYQLERIASPRCE